MKRKFWNGPMVSNFVICTKPDRPDEELLDDLVQVLEIGQVRKRVRCGRKQSFEVGNFHVLAAFHANANHWEDDWLLADLLETMPADVAELVVDHHRLGFGRVMLGPAKKKGD